MKSLGPLFYFLLIFPLVALAHDFYFLWQNYQAADQPVFFLSDLGWMAVTYTPELYDTVRQSVDTEIWVALIYPVLSQPSVFVLGAPVVFLAFIIVMLKIFGLGPFKGEGWLLSRSYYRDKDKKSLRKNNNRKTGPYKYRRR